ncbi:tetratricopeptide repeat protein [Paraliomyxa miuraensis]|uniref:tetratricopeptide repeat protein n=1 Tax=Paraliomyxa miuraensis TaxID=376150 RepID=UPI00225B85B3|nr:tetratricopeptide repeat protein [Paraliomyxa miuraensis]MCX4246916.1 tetratricopeptide repeat protein [Paraliomyxa miuraensis]
MHEVWTRALEGNPVVVLGNPPAAPQTADGEPRWVEIRVACDGPRSTWGPLEEARRRIEALLGEQSPRWDEALDRMGPRARLLSDMGEPTLEATLVGAANRLADQRPRRAALVVEGLDAADAATLQELRDIVGREGWLRLPLVLGVRTMPGEGAVAELLRSIEGEPVVVEAPVEPTPFDWMSLPPELLLVMRAAAVVGRSFEVELVGRLLGVSPDAVLVRLQQAADLGAPLADQGGGRFFLPEAAQQTLVRRVLPSLVERWHRRLGEILAEPAPPPPDADVDEPRFEAKASAPVAEEPELVDEPELEPPEQERAPVEPVEPGAVIEPATPVDAEPTPAPPGSSAQLPSDETITYGEIFEPPVEERLSSRAREAEPASPPRATTSEHTIRLDDDAYERVMASARASVDPRDQARAAHHLLEAGLPQRAVEQYLAALRKVAARGDSRRALLIADQALALLERQPPSRARDLLHAQVLAMAARVQWRGAGRGPALTLQGALETLDEAEQLVGSDGPLDLRTEIAQLVAGVCYDLGDIASLQRALDALTGAARSLMAAGESVRAARLLNDQAAVYLRAGDPVRANHLLQQSRSIFDELHRERPDDPTVITERAETEHLLARLPLHARLRPGREDDAFSMALGHARAAAEGYRRLGGRVELGRVSETMGRLETARGRYERAAEHLEAALSLSRELGDVIGLARTTAALAELYSAAGRPSEALAALRDSVAFNVDKGSPLGLAVNRRALEQLRHAVTGDPRTSPTLLRAVRELDASLGEAERLLGRVSVPGDVD